MATKNEDLITETAEAILKSIKESAESTNSAAHLKDLAEALALVAGADPRTARRPRPVVDS